MSWLSKFLNDIDPLTISEEELLTQPQPQPIEDTRSPAERTLHSMRTNLDRAETRRDQLIEKITTLNAELREIDAIIVAFKAGHDQLVEFCASRDNMPRATNGNNL